MSSHGAGRIDGNTAIRTATAGVVSAVAAFAAVISYDHIYDLARDHGGTVLAARLLPLSVDGLILAMSLVMLHEARSARTAPALARGMLGLGVGATVAANVLYGLSFGWLGALLWAWPAVAFVGAVEVDLIMVRKGRPVTSGSGDFVTPAGTVSSDSVEAAKARIRLALSHGFKISDNDLRAQFRLTRSEATKARSEVLAETNGSVHAEEEEKV
jgi:Protein of unknown function (DUF2637)